MNIRIGASSAFAVLLTLMVAGHQVPSSYALVNNHTPHHLHARVDRIDVANKRMTPRKLVLRTARTSPDDIENGDKNEDSFVTDAAAVAGTTTSTTTKQPQSKSSRRYALSIPLTLDEMVRQAASAMREAAALGRTRQIVRILLPRDASSGDFGTYLEASATSSSTSSSSGSRSQQVVLVPPDESWQGGIMQLYRAAAPTAESILRAVTSATSGLPPRVSEDRSVDESGVDGVGLLETDDKAVTCWLQPTQENVDAVVRTAGKAKADKLVVLMNPQWRMVDDALDQASKGKGLMSNLASFLGGKGAALRQLEQAGFTPVFTLEGYVCRGANVRLMQVLDSEWSVFCERDDAESFLTVGNSPTRPSYQQVDEMLAMSDIGPKYARDMGWQPKL
jgi:Domain of unknown function (DUF1995)